MRILLKIVEFFFRAGTEKDLLGEAWKGSRRVPLPEEDDVVAIVPILGLEEGAIGEEVSNVAVTISAHTSDIIDGVITAIAGRDHMVAPLEVIREEIYAVEIARDINAGESEAGCRDVEDGSQFPAHCAGFQALVGSEDDERDMGAGFGAELLGPDGVIVPVVREPEDDGVLQKTIGFQVIHDPACVFISLAHSVIVVSMPLAEEIVPGEAGRGSHGSGIHLVSPFPGVAFTTCQLNLAEPWIVLGDLSPYRQVAFPSFN
jgi:hypothetical protein